MINVDSFEEYKEYKPLPTKSWINRTLSPMSIGSVRASIYTLCASIIGAGELSLPLAVSECGLVTGILLLILGGALFSYYYYQLAYVSDVKGIYDYVTLVKSFYGESGRRITEIGMFFVSYGAISAYMVTNIQILTVQMLVSVSISFGIIQESDERWLSITLSLILLAVVWIPMCLPKEITFLRYCSTLCIIGIIYITLVLAFQAPQYITRETMSKVTIFKVNSKFFSAVGVTLFAYDGGQNIPSIQNELVFRSKRRIKKVICRGMFIVTLSYVIMGVLGYLTNVTNTPDLIVFREPASGQKSSDWPMVIGRIFVAIYLNMNLPVQLYPTRLSLERMIWGTEVEHKKLRHYALTIGILISNLILAILLPDAIFFFKIVGSVFAMPICIIIPAILYCKTIDSGLEKAISMLGVMITTLLAVGCIADTLVASS